MRDQRGPVTGEWSDLAFLNYRVDPGLLAPHLPAGTEPDLWRGECWLSVVGLHVRDLRIGGAPAPLHRNFAQVNLRLCVRRVVRAAGATEVRPGAVLLREWVPRPALAAAPGLAREEPLQPATLRRRTAPGADPDAGAVAEYVWDELIRGGRLFAEARGPAEPLPAGSFEEWIVERCWGYSGRAGGPAAEYRVEHPRWTVRPAARAQLSGNLAATFGEEFADVLHGEPQSAFLVGGSMVTVHAPEPI
ncbi:MAG TPA: DUF2071 domain-containing protein [Longimicrobiaceae bacterium]